MSALVVASYLTEPICKVRESFYRFYTLGQKKTIWKVAVLALTILLCSLLTPFTAPFGVALRGIVSVVESKPYVYWKGAAQGKALGEEGRLTLASHNVCLMPAGYCITDGQVVPGWGRMEQNLERIRALDPDVVCLFEVADVCDASRIASALPNYPFVIPVAGVRAVGPSSMMYVASKYELAKIEFVPFVKGTELTGRARYSEKGFLSCDLMSEGKPFACVVSTHLQHSEIPAEPTEGDRIARALQMRKIAQHIEKKVAQGLAVILTGDLNMDEGELEAVFKEHRIDWLRRDARVQGKATWGGDQWCARLMGKWASGALTLDYTFVAGKVAEIATRVIGTGYSGRELRKEAGSDHGLLFSEVLLAT